MIVVCKQEQCEYNKNGRCAQKVLIIEKDGQIAYCKYWCNERVDYFNKHGMYPKEFAPRDEIIIEEGRPAQ